MTQSVIHNRYVILPKVSTYEENVKALQAEALAALQKDLAKRPADPLRAERNMFLMVLIKARLRAGLSQAELAARLSTQQSAIARIESGHGNPGLNKLLEIAKALEVDLVLEYKY
jgi:ribosome-binding protein aMBF1 (putative translation factor)